MTHRTIAGREVGAIGLGCMGMSWVYTGPVNESAAVLDRALGLGVNFWDTADVYGSGANETLIGPAVRAHRDEVFLATKFGNVFDRALTSHQDLVAAGDQWIVDGTPAYARRCVEASLRRLGVDVIDLYYLHRVDPRVPIEETVGAMAEFVREGKVRHIGLSEVGVPTLARARAVHPIAAVQNELSLWTRDSLDDVMPYCEREGIAFVAYSPLGRGYLTGALRSRADLADDDWRRNHPRFSDENFAANWRLVEAVEALAAARGVPASQVALAWVLQRSPATRPIPGTKRVAYLESNAAAATLTLSAEEMAALDALGEAQGTRYAAPGMRFVKA